MFNYSVYLYWIGNGAAQAAVVGIFSYELLESASIADGLMGGFWPTGTVVLLYATLNATFKVSAQLFRLSCSRTHTRSR